VPDFGLLAQGSEHSYEDSTSMASSIGPMTPLFLITVPGIVITLPTITINDPDRPE
jgi:hypothetical protein